jgi:hypothetical protein
LRVALFLVFREQKAALYQYAMPPRLTSSHAT